MLSLKFHKDPERIGGGITEINYDGHRLIIDMGAEFRVGQAGAVICNIGNNLSPFNGESRGIRAVVFSVVRNIFFGTSQPY